MGDIQIISSALEAIHGILQQLIALLGDLLQLLGQPFKFTWTWFSVRRRLRANLGEWASEAVRHGRWQQPVLSQAAFERHLRDTNGRLECTGETTSSFAWARMLCALNIRPGGLILEWEPLRDGLDPLATGHLPLKMEGPVLCHLLNLYRLYYDPSPYVVTEDMDASITLQFGTLDISWEDGDLAVYFSAGSPNTLKAHKEPFMYNSLHVPPGVKLDFSGDQGVEAYFRTLREGMSDESCKWPDRKAKLSERIDVLVKNLKRLRLDDWAKPYLVTHAWLEEGSRIFRRVTTNDEDEPALLQDILDTFYANSDTKEKFQVFAPEHDDNGNDWRSRLEGILLQRCLFGKDRLSLIWTTGNITTNRIDTAIAVIMEQNLPEILGTLSCKASGILAKEVQESSEEVAYLFEHGPKVRNCPGFALEFTSESPLWHSSVDLN